MKIKRHQRNDKILIKGVTIVFNKERYLNYKKTKNIFVIRTPLIKDCHSQKTN